MEETNMEETSRIADVSKGYEFFRKIGSPKFIVAPMVDHSELAYRLLTRRYGADLVYTQMFNANAFINSVGYLDDNFTTCTEDRPLIVQFAGHDPEIMLQAARSIEHLCDAVDINLGCPQGIARRGRYGSFLMEELELLERMVSTLSQGLKVPVTCKTRIYKDFDRTIKLLETLVGAGASMLCVHARTREQKGQFVGSADWDVLRRIKRHFGNRLPIIANGGIRTVEDIYRCIEETGVDGVMTSEAVLENPALFVSNINPQSGLPVSQLDLAEEYLDLVSVYPAWHMRTVRSHIMKFLYRYFLVYPQFRDQASSADTIDEFRSVIQGCREREQQEKEEDSTHEKFTNIWYDRYRSTDPAIHPVLRHENLGKDCRPVDNLLDQLNGDDEESSCGLFGDFIHFEEEE